MRFVEVAYIFFYRVFGLYYKLFRQMFMNIRWLGEFSMVWVEVEVAF